MRFFDFFTQSDAPQPLMVPDSLQKANLTEFVNKVIEMDFKEVLSALGEDIMWIIIKFVIAITIYFIGRWIMKRVLRLLEITLKRRNVDKSLRQFLHGTINIIFYLVLLLFVVQTLGVNITSLIAIFSAATLAIGMALSGTVQNFAGGAMILLLKPYRVGDYIETQSVEGFVQEIKLFNTVIATYDNQTIYIPNSLIISSVIDNYTSSKTRRVEWKMGITYGDDVAAVRRVVMEMFANDERILKDPEATVSLTGLGDSSVNVVVRAWCATEDYWTLHFEYYERLYNELPTKAGIKFPFPQMDIHIKENNTKL